MIANLRRRIKLRKTILTYASGIISGAADNDPSGIATYSIAGARFGYSQNFLMILTTPMLIAVQTMAGRLGEVQGKGLTATLREFLSPPLTYLIVFSLVIANIFTLGADISMMGDSASLVFPLEPKVWAALFSIVAWYFVLFKSFKSLQKYFLWLVLFFLSYIGAAFLSKPDWLEVLRSTFLPEVEINPNFLVSALATMGTTITPYLFFWQAKEELEFRHSKKFSLSFARAEERHLAPGMVFSQLITIFIMIASGSFLYKHGVTDILTAADAARALEPFAGSFSRIIFSLGVVGSGLVALPVLSSTTAYAVAELFGWKDSLWDKVNQAKRFYGLITLSIFLSLLIALLPFNVIGLLFYSQVLNGVLAPFLIIVLLYLCNNKKVMGKEVNNLFDNFWGSLSVLVMLGFIIYLVVSMIH